MHIELKQPDLVTALSRISGAVKKKNTIPVLSNVLLHADDTLTLTGTDLDVTIRTICPVTQYRPGTLCANARKLLDIARALPTDAIITLKQEDDKLHITSGRSKFRLPTVPARDFPDTTAPAEEWLTLEGTEWQKALRLALLSVTMEESRYALSGVLFEATADKLRLVSTNGHRLTAVDVTATPRREGSVILPRKACEQVLKLDSDCTVAMDLDAVQFTDGRTVLISRLLSGQFPNYQMVLPKENKIVVTVDAKATAAMFRRVLVQADERTHMVLLTLQDGRLLVEAHETEDGTVSDEVDVAFDGNKLSAGFNGRYLTDFLNAVTGPVDIAFKDGQTQALLSQGNVRYVVMPVRL